MSYLDVSMSGWYKTSMMFRIIAKQKREEVEVFKCIDIKGREFYIEDSSIFEDYSRNSSTYTTTIELNLGEVIEKLQHNKSIYEVKFIDTKGDEKMIRGYTIGPDENFGYTKCVDLDKVSATDKGIRNINNRGIQYLILNNTKYIVK
jgi:hypothetical protein